MIMRTRRLLGAATAAVLIAAPFAASASAANAAKKGVGTGTISTSVLELAIGGGDVLSVRVLGNDVTSTIDGAGSASTNLVPIAIASKLAPALDAASPAVSTSSTGAKDEKTHEAAVPAVPGFAGSLNAAVSSVVDAAGARSGLAAGLANLSLAGGLAKVPQGVLDLSTDASATQTVAAQTLRIPSATVLDLSALLEGLGLKLSDLSVDTLLDLVEGLGLPLNGVADPRALVNDLNEAVATLEGETGTITAEVCSTVDGILGGGLDTVGGVVGGVVGEVDAVTPAPLPDLGGVVGGLFAAGLLGDLDCDDLVGLDVADVLQDVEDTLGSLLGGILKALDGVALLSVQGIEVSIASTATDAVETSVADVTAKIGSVKVGSLPVPGVADLDLTAPAAIVNQAAEAIQAQLNGVLATINSQLTGIVDVDVLDIEEVVGSKDGVVEALSKVTALRATITPPTGLLSAAVVDVDGTIAGALAGLGTALPALDPLMSQLEGALGGVDALTERTVLTVGTVSADAAFRPAAAQLTPGGGPGDPGSGTGTGTPGTLPRTGTDAALPAMAAVALAGMALAIRRLLRQTTI
jgi:hypothetical protein